jgi:hypothetical protein
LRRILNASRRTSDPNDARSAAIVARQNPSLNVVAGVNEHRVVLRLLAARDHQVTAGAPPVRRGPSTRARKAWAGRIEWNPPLRVQRPLACQAPPERRSEMTDPSKPDALWLPWKVAQKSGFEVCDPNGEVGLIQIDKKQFSVTKPFRFSDERVVRMLTDRLIRDGRSADEALAAVEDARTFTPSTENPTDLASIPRYMRWFESAYGLHTLAAIIHDDLIVKEPNKGPLHSDTLSDRFFREMMRSAGVRWLKRWIMWSAVALRSRWAAGGPRRASVLIWLLLAAAGITAAVWAFGSRFLAWPDPIDRPLILAFALVLPFAAAPLWGRQYGAGLVAAIAALWILPAAVLAGVGYLLYLCLEWGARKLGLT